MSTGWTASGGSASSAALEEARTRFFADAERVTYMAFGGNSENAHAVFISDRFDLACRWFHLYPHSTDEQLDETTECSRRQAPQLILVTLGFFDSRAGVSWRAFVSNARRLLDSEYELVATRPPGFQVWKRKDASDRPPDEGADGCRARPSSRRGAREACPHRARLARLETRPGRPGALPRVRAAAVGWRAPVSQSPDARALQARYFAVELNRVSGRTMGGVAENIALPAERHVSFALTGAAAGITAVRADVAKALGEQINLDIAGDWKAGAADPPCQGSAVGQRPQRPACGRRRRLCIQRRHQGEGRQHRALLGAGGTPTVRRPGHGRRRQHRADQRRVRPVDRQRGVGARDRQRAGRQSACRRYPHHGQSGARRRPGLSQGNCGSSTARPLQRPMARSPAVLPTSTSISS